MDYKGIKALLEEQFRLDGSDGGWSAKRLQLAGFLVARAVEEKRLKKCRSFLQGVGMTSVHIPRHPRSVVDTLKAELSEIRQSRETQESRSRDLFASQLQAILNQGGAGADELAAMDREHTGWCTDDMRAMVEVALMVLEQRELARLTIEEHETINAVRSRR